MRDGGHFCIPMTEPMPPLDVIANQKAHTPNDERAQPDDPRPDLDEDEQKKAKEEE